MRHCADCTYRDAVGGASDVDTETVVGPGAELDHTQLIVEREIAHINITRGGEHTAWLPVHVTIVTNQNTYSAEVRRQQLGSVTSETVQ